MKLTKKIALTVATLALSSATSSAALLLTFTEDGNDVVLTVSGSVDVSSAIFNSDHTYNGPSSSYNVGVENINSTDVFEAGTSADVVIGIDLLTSPFVSGSTYGSSTGGSGDFYIWGATFQAYSSTDTNVSDDGALNASVTTSDKVITFSSNTFATMGLDAHATNTDIGLWRASAGAGDAGTVNFRVVAVPEPSSTALLGLGALGLIARRRR